MGRTAWGYPGIPLRLVFGDKDGISMMLIEILEDIHSKIKLMVSLFTRKYVVHSYSTLNGLISLTILYGENQEFMLPCVLFRLD